jgi:hypothetical protein
MRNAPEAALRRRSTGAGGPDREARHDRDVCHVSTSFRPGFTGNRSMSDRSSRCDQVWADIQSPSGAVDLHTFAISATAAGECNHGGLP